MPGHSSPEHVQRAVERPLGYVLGVQIHRHALAADLAADSSASKKYDAESTPSSRSEQRAGLRLWVAERLG